VITTMILVFGFAPFAISVHYQEMGPLRPFALIVALPADFLLAPALVGLGAIRFSKIQASRT